MDDHEIILQLTTTEETIFSTMPQEMELELFKEKMPVLCVTFNMPVFLKKEKMEKILMEMATTVHVDTEKKYLRIGEKDKPLAEGSDLKESKRINSFFERWAELKALLFAFNCIHDNEYRYGIKGIWAENRWQWLIFETEISIQMGEPIDGSGTDIIRKIKTS